MLISINKTSSFISNFNWSFLPSFSFIFCVHFLLNFLSWRETFKKQKYITNLFWIECQHLRFTWAQFCSLIVLNHGHFNDWFNGCLFSAMFLLLTLSLSFSFPLYSYAYHIVMVCYYWHVPRHLYSTLSLLLNSKMFTHNRH